MTDLETGRLHPNQLSPEAQIRRQTFEAAKMNDLSEFATKVSDTNELLFASEPLHFLHGSGIIRGV